MVERATLPEEDEDEFYHVDLIGCRAESEGGAALGTVKAVHDFGAGPLLEVGENGRTRLFPFTKDAVPVVDVAGGRVVIATAALAEEDEDETKRGDNETR
jgi:16S rRNA processing protein RimM